MTSGFPAFFDAVPAITLRDPLAEILGAAGLITVKDMRSAGVDAYDVKLCRPALREFANYKRRANPEAGQ